MTCGNEGIAAHIKRQIGRNKVLTIVLAGVAILNAGVVIAMLGGLSASWDGALFGVGIIVAWVLCVYGFFEATVLRSTGARPLPPAEERYLTPMITRLAGAIQHPVPRLMVIHDAAPNAFAVGTGPRATIVFTTGLLALLNTDELEGVAAHELSHIANGDTRIANYSAALLGWPVVISAAVTTVAVGLVFGGGGLMGGGGRDDDWTATLARLCVGIGLIAVAACVWISAQVWFLIARIAHLGISRQREWIADASAAKTTGKPLALASALEKLLEYDTTLHHGQRVAQALCIAGTPRRHRWWEDVFDTHPNILERIARLRAYAV